MATGATIHTFTVQLADVDRGVYEDVTLRVARHPSETDAFMMTRVLAYCLEFEEGIAFSDGIAATDEPAVHVRDLTGKLTAWIEVGAPDADRLHRASKLGGRVAVYTHRELRQFLGPLEGKKIHRAAEIPIYTFGRGFIDALAERLERRVRISLSVTERHLYLDVDGTSLTTVIDEQRLDAA